MGRELLCMDVISRIQQIIVLSSGVSFSDELMKQNNPSKTCVYLNAITIKIRIFCRLKLTFVQLEFESAYFINGALKNCIKPKNKEKKQILNNFTGKNTSLSELSWVQPFWGCLFPEMKHHSRGLFIGGELVAVSSCFM